MYAEHDTKIKVGEKNNHRNTGVVESFNKQLAIRLYKYQSQKELSLEEGLYNHEWVKHLPKVIDEMNNSVTRLIKMKPIDAIELNTPIQQYAGNLP